MTSVPSRARALHAGAHHGAPPPPFPTGARLALAMTSVLERLPSDARHGASAASAAAVLVLDDAPATPAPRTAPDTAPDTALPPRLISLHLNAAAAPLAKTAMGAVVGTDTGAVLGAPRVVQLRLRAAAAESTAAAVPAAAAAAAEATRWREEAAALRQALEAARAECTYLAASAALDAHGWHGAALAAAEAAAAQAAAAAASAQADAAEARREASQRAEEKVRLVNCL